MTIRKYMEKLCAADPRVIPIMSDTVEIWKNGACMGYAIQAAQEIGLTQDQTFKLIRAMKATMDKMSVDDAEDFWALSPY